MTLSTTATSYIYVEIKNPTARNVKVSLWDTAATAGPTDMLMSAYPGAVPPQDADANARKACVNYTMNGCDSTVATACTSIFLPGLMIDEVPDHSVTIPAGGSITVYNAAYSAATVGDFNLNTRTEN